VEASLGELPASVIDDRAVCQDGSRVVLAQTILPNVEEDTPTSNLVAGDGEGMEICNEEVRANQSKKLVAEDASMAVVDVLGNVEPSTNVEISVEFNQQEVATSLSIPYYMLSCLGRSQRQLSIPSD